MKFGLIVHLFSLSRRAKKTILVATDLVLIFGSFIAAMWLRLDRTDFLFDATIWAAIGLVSVVSVALFIRVGFYRAVIRFLGPQALNTIVTAIALSALSIYGAKYLLDAAIPRSVPIIYGALAMMTLGGTRLIMRAMFHAHALKHRNRVLIYGAGTAGRQLLGTLRAGQDYHAIAFVDDQPEFSHTTIEGLPVLNVKDLARTLPHLSVDAILLAIPSASARKRAQIVKQLETLRVAIKVVPLLEELVSGQAKIDEIKDVSIDDILGRDPVSPIPTLMDANIHNQTVMVTGAGGSIGRELCKQILRRNPKALILFERSEFALYDAEKDLISLGKSIQTKTDIFPVLGDVQSRARLDEVLAHFDVATIYHAAAYKHVPMIEQNVIEGVNNNVFGTLEVAKAAIGAGVPSFVLISTDKAVRPTNIMGATKRMAELVCQALARTQNTTLFSMVRFGNVLGSSGSVVPLFRDQIQNGGPITVTHPKITRYFMTIPEAAQLVLQAGALAKGGDVFLLDMGEPVNIADLAARMARLSGHSPVFEHKIQMGIPKGPRDITIRFTGLRPGEKLYEELLIDDTARPTRHPRIMSAQEIYLSWNELSPILTQLRLAAETRNVAQLRDVLAKAPTAYTPAIEIADLMAEKITADRPRDPTKTRSLLPPPTARLA